MRTIFILKSVLLLLYVTLFVTPVAFGQYAENTIEKLASPSFHGRGYYKNGDGIAAKFIRKEYERIGLQPVNGNFFQPFSFPVNTFPGKMKVTLGDSKLIAGKDYIVSPACPSVKGKFEVVKVTWPVQQFKSTDFICSIKPGWIQPVPLQWIPLQEIHRM